MNYILIIILLLIYSILIYIYKAKIAFFFKIIDNPDNNRKIHTNPIPAIGGLYIYPIIAISLIVSFYQNNQGAKIYLIYFFLTTYFFYLGFLDDRYQLNAKIKTIFIITVLFIIIPLDDNLVIKSLNFLDYEKKIFLNQASLLLTVFCIFFLYNSLNFSDGLNGIAISLCIYWSIILIFKNTNIDVFLVTVLTTLIFILIPNLLNKVFLGNSGVSLLSIIFSLLYINYYKNGYIFFDEIILIHFLPCIDTVRVVFQRMINNKSPLAGDQSHLHHLMINLINKKYVFIPYIILAILPYLLLLFGLNTFYCFIISVVIYYLLVFFLKNKLQNF